MLYLYSHVHSHYTWKDWSPNQRDTILNKGVVSSLRIYFTNVLWMRACSLLCSNETTNTIAFEAKNETHMRKEHSSIDQPYCGHVGIFNLNILGTRYERYTNVWSHSIKTTFMKSSTDNRR